MVEWEDFICGEELMREYACIECATSHGHSQEAAEECDDGNVGCPDCPFKTVKEVG